MSSGIHPGYNSYDITRYLATHAEALLARQSQHHNLASAIIIY